MIKIAGDTQKWRETKKNHGYSKKHLNIFRRTKHVGNDVTKGEKKNFQNEQKKIEKNQQNRLFCYIFIVVDGL